MKSVKEQDYNYKYMDTHDGSYSKDLWTCKARVIIGTWHKWSLMRSTGDRSSRQQVESVCYSLPPHPVSYQADGAPSRMQVAKYRSLTSAETYKPTISAGG